MNEPQRREDEKEQNLGLYCKYGKMQVLGKLRLPVFAVNKFLSFPPLRLKTKLVNHPPSLLQSS